MFSSTTTLRTRVAGVLCLASLGTTPRRHAVEATSSAQVLEKRDPYRAGHLGLIKEMAAEGRVLSAGAFTDPVDGAMFVFTDREAADEFKAKDPYGPHVVAGSHVREWTTVDLP